MSMHRPFPLSVPSVFLRVAKTTGRQKVTETGCRESLTETRNDTTSDKNVLGCVRVLFDHHGVTAYQWLGIENPAGIAPVRAMSRPCRAESHLERINPCRDRFTRHPARLQP